MSKKASLQEIKSSFRHLAHAFHPDKNPDNEIVSAYFIEIKEAYSVLGNPTSRRVYDRERSRLGEGKKEMPPVSARFILNEFEKIESILASGTRLSVNKELLAEYIHFLLAQNNLAVLLKENDVEGHQNLIFKILQFSEKLGFEFFEKMEADLRTLAQQENSILSAISLTHSKLKKEVYLQKAVPYLVVLLTILLCLAMYWYAKK